MALYKPRYIGDPPIGIGVQKIPAYEQRANVPWYLNPPSIQNVNEGSSSTHKMMSFEIDGKFYAAPTIVNINNTLQELTPKDAIEYAMRNGEYRQFQTEKDAQWYAEGGYKIGTKLYKR